MYYMHAHVCQHLGMCTHIFAHVSMCEYICVHECVHVSMSVCQCMYELLTSMPAHMCTQEYPCTCIHLCLHLHVCMDLYIQAYTFTCTHTDVHEPAHTLHLYPSTEM